MNNQRAWIKLGSLIIISILIIVLIYLLNIYKLNYFNEFEKATAKEEYTKFSRDSEVKHSESNSYKIENLDYNDATFYKEIEVEPNTPYKITCMVKTENIQLEFENKNGGVIIGLLDTVEYSPPIKDTNEWQQLEYIFDSKNREKVKISFRLGGNDNNCKGTAWFSDFKVEKGTAITDSKWNIGCFIIKEIKVDIDGKQYDLKTNLEDIENVRLNMKRYQETCYEFSNEIMESTYEITEIDTPVTSITYSDEHGYFISYNDVKDLIYKTAIEKEYDHVFVICRMENEEGDITIPILDNWIGLGSMDMYGIGYSLIRINKNANTHNYKYGISNHAPEEVYLHEFLHTLERNTIERGHDTPALHDYEKYGYTVSVTEGLNDWYEDYMRGTILDSNTGKYVGLNGIAYYTQPFHQSNFKYPVEIDFNVEPKNIIEEILTVIQALKNE